MEAVLTHSKDHQSALEIISQLGEYRTRKGLDLILKTSLVPLVGCSGAFYARMETEPNTPQLLDIINQSSFCQCQWKNPCLSG